MSGNRWSEQEIKEYTEKGEWKCAESPTGAHHWDISGTKMKCRCCDVIKDTPIYMNQSQIYRQHQAKRKVNS